MIALSYLEMHGLVVHLRTGKNVEGERTTGVFFKVVVPFESAETYLEGYELFANKLDLLVALLHIVIVVHFVFECCRVTCMNSLQN